MLVVLGCYGAKVGMFGGMLGVFGVGGGFGSNLGCVL